MESIVSYPSRGEYGNNRYRGNCSGLLIEDLIRQYRLEGLSDFMVGSGTTEDVVRKAGIRGDFADLNRGYDMMSMDIPSRAENCFWHPPYGDMIQYSGSQYSDRKILEEYGIDCSQADLSRCRDWDEFVQKMNYCMMKQFAALEKGGRMFVLMGDMKKRGRLYSMLADIVKPGKLEQIIIKAQHNTWSERQSYSNRNFVPIVHEYLMVVQKENGLYIPVSMTSKQSLDIRDSVSASWRDVVMAVLEEQGGQMCLDELYAKLQGYRKASLNVHWKEKVRQTVQNLRYFTRTGRGVYALAA